MSCRYKDECPSYTGWCEGPKQDFSKCVEFLITSNELLLKRFRHLIESDVVSLYDEVDRRTGGYKRDIKELDKMFGNKFTEVNPFNGSMPELPKPQGSSIKEGALTADINMNGRIETNNNILVIVTFKSLMGADDIKNAREDIAERIKQGVFIKDNSISKITFVDRETGKIVGEL